MRMNVNRFIGAMLWFLLAQPGTPQQTATTAGSDWPMYRYDRAGTGYSPLAQINTTNVANLIQAWTLSLQGDVPAAATAGGRGLNSEATPIVVGGVMYVPTANRVLALEADTGKEIWSYPLTAGAPSRRGVAYWPGQGADLPRIIFTSGRRLIALSARTGENVSGFGKDGEVDLGIPYNSVPGIYRNVVVVGANTPPGTSGGIGNPRAFDARTGAKLWEFSSVPQPGTVGHDTWEGDSWKGRLGVNAWPFYFTMDEQRGLLYLPLASPIGGYYGGDRKGANLFGNSVVAVDIQTGAYKWHFQTIHHDLWDADPPAPPGLFDIVRGGRTIPALAVTTKSGYMYILNRETGQSVFGVEERPVSKSDVPGEMAFPAQPIPVKPPALARVSYKPEDLVSAADTTAEHAKACQELIDKIGGVRNSGPFTPFGYRAEGTRPGSTLVFPGGLGGANWGGTACYIFVATQDVGALGSIEKAREGSPFLYEKTTPGQSTFDVRMGETSWPCQKPPWGRLTAINSSTGDIAWQTPLGITDQLPEGKQNTGRPALAGPIVTAGGVLFIASTDDNRFRALDAKTGKQLWVTKLARRGNADPITYRGRNGKQYVAIVATDAVMVFALP
ncbi:MAG: pyrroloquinoline quinone-dependent dehydrogenase [Acidobacteria bacterium]|nr:MAG: pyrroloquinoline quinone-dependent dehydrogenase [Acidobacteriota bacterium]